MEENITLNLKIKEIFSIAIIYRITIARNTFENSIL